MRRTTWAVALASASAACSTPATSPAPVTPARSDLVAEFVGTVDAAKGRIEIQVLGEGAQGLGVLPNHRPPTAGMRLITLSTGSGAAACGGIAGSFCGTVRAEWNRADVEALDVFAEITSMTPSSVSALNSSSPPDGAGLSAAFGLFGYGKLGALGGGGNTADRLWVFPDATNFTFRGRIRGVTAAPGVHDLPTKGGPIAVNEAGDTLAVANLDTDDVTLFALPGMTERARIPAGDEPTGVCWAPDSSTLFVVSRGDGNLRKFTGADTAAPTPAGVDFAGSEAARCATSPSGDDVYVTSWVDGTVTRFTNSPFAASERVLVGGNPFAVCVTNDLDADDADETIFVTDFYSRPRAGFTEVNDEGRIGRVFRLDASTFTLAGSVTLLPFADAGSFVGGTIAGTGAFANQLYSCAVNAGRLFVTSVGASPESFANATDFHQNAQGLLYAFELGSFAPVPSLTVNLNSLVEVQTPPRRFMTVPSDLAFAGRDSNRPFVVSLNSDAILRVNPGSPTTGAHAGGQNFIDTGLSPMGIAIAGDRAFVYNEVGYSVTEANIATGAQLVENHASAPLPAGTSPAGRELRGKRFFNTGLARWSSNGWLGCAACHPFGTTDNVTWAFPAGPRQTIDLTASWDSSRTQRIFNWTAIFDEVHDFELNIRSVSGGVGAIVTSDDLALGNAARIDIAATPPTGLPNTFNRGSSRAVFQGSDPLSALADENGNAADDWDVIDEWLAGLRSPRGKSAAALGGDPAAGRTLFQNGGCHRCHGDVGGNNLWTLSRLYYTPTRDSNLTDDTLFEEGVASIGVDPALVDSTDPTLVTVLSNDPPPSNFQPRHSCVIRKVGTFGNVGPDGRGAVEVRQNPALVAQGVSGFNVPSLLNMSTGAPYLHGGAAESLAALLSPTGEFQTHLRAGNASFNPTASELGDLIAFVESIDDGTTPIALAASQDFCPNGVTDGP